MSKPLAGTASNTSPPAATISSRPTRFTQAARLSSGLGTGEMEAVARSAGAAALCCSITFARFSAKMDACSSVSLGSGGSSGIGVCGYLATKADRFSGGYT